MQALSRAGDQVRTINFGGLGQLINELAERYDLPGTYAAICFVILVSVLFFMAVEKAERWLTRAN